MSTGKDYGLPEEYHEWETRDAKLTDFGDFITVTAHRHQGQSSRTSIPVAQLFPPKPKLPEPQPVGTVIGYTTPVGYKRRAIRNPRGWDVYGPEGNILCNVSEAGMHRELQHATDYTVLVGGFDRDAGEVLRNHVNAVSADLMTAIRKQGGIGL